MLNDLSEPQDLLPPPLDAAPGGTADLLEAGGGVLPPPAPLESLDLLGLQSMAAPPEASLDAAAAVAGLEDVLSQLGSSSSGSTAGQLGSAHGSGSDKDSESPQESQDTQIEGFLASDDLPPPPPVQDSDQEAEDSLEVAGVAVNVTVNPMADLGEDLGEDHPPPPPPLPLDVLPPPPPQPELPPAGGAVGAAAAGAGAASPPASSSAVSSDGSSSSTAGSVVHLGSPKDGADASEV